MHGSAGVQERSGIRERDDGKQRLCLLSIRGGDRLRLRAFCLPTALHDPASAGFFIAQGN
jgi:hypothetical protein